MEPIPESTIVLSEEEERQQARYLADCEKHGCILPWPMRFRKGPVGEDGLPLYPEREPIAVYPDGTFPIVKVLHKKSEEVSDEEPLRMAG